MPQGTATTARHLGAPSAPFRFAPAPVGRPLASVTRALARHNAQRDGGSRPRFLPTTNHQQPTTTPAATDLEYEVTRVKSPVLGRDLNPLGRGDGTYYCSGGSKVTACCVAVRSAKPPFLGIVSGGYGNSINNQGDAVAGASGEATGDGCQDRIDDLEEELAKHHQRVASLMLMIKLCMDELDKLLAKEKELQDKLEEKRREYEQKQQELRDILNDCYLICELLLVSFLILICKARCREDYANASIILLQNWQKIKWPLERDILHVQRQIRNKKDEIDFFAMALRSAYAAIAKLEKELAETSRQCRHTGASDEAEVLIAGAAASACDSCEVFLIPVDGHSLGGRWEVA